MVFTHTLSSHRSYFHMSDVFPNIEWLAEEPQTSSELLGAQSHWSHRNRMRQNADLSRRFRLIWAVQLDRKSVV